MKKILIVGATSGIGEGLARMYAESRDVRIGVTGRAASGDFVLPWETPVPRFRGKGKSA